MLFDLQTYQIIAYCLIGLLMILFGFTAGFDLGIGFLLPFVGRTNDEKRVVINSIGPTWDGNQVWLVILGGSIFVLWPYAYALAFSGFYGAMMLLLWSLFLRPVAFEWRSKINTPGWRKVWDLSLFLGSFIPAIAIGLVIGNIMRGVPFHYDSISLRAFYTGNFFQLFNPFSLLVAFVCFFLLVMHGSMYLRLRTTEKIHRRCRAVTAIFGVFFILAFFAAGWWIRDGLTGYQLVKAAGLTNMTHNIVKVVPGALLANYKIYPWMTFAPIAAFAGALIAILSSLFKRLSLIGFFGSSVAVICSVLTFGFSMFPFIMTSSTNPNNSLTAWNASATQYTLQTIFIAMIIFVPTIGLYTLWVFRKLWGKTNKITVDTIRTEDHALY